MQQKLSLGMLVFVLLLSTPLFAQLGKTWPYSANYPYTLKGNVKSWVLTGEKGILRTQHYSREGILTNDECVNPIGTSSSKSGFPQIIKALLESEVDTLQLLKEPIFSYRFNKRSQIIEKRTSNLVQQNIFNEEGQIIISKSKSFHTQTRAWNSLHHAQPTYTYTDTIEVVTIFKYNEMGSLIDFQFYDNNLDNSYRIVYNRDSADQLIERLEYSVLEIAYNQDDSATRIAKEAMDDTFDIDQFIPYFWRASGTSPLKETFAYNDFGQQTNYSCYCLRSRNAPFESFKAEWEYDEEGRIVKETQYSRHEYYQDYWVSGELEYDSHENIVKETVYYGDDMYVFHYAITYWD